MKDGLGSETIKALKMALKELKNSYKEPFQLISLG